MADNPKGKSGSFRDKALFAFLTGTAGPIILNGLGMISDPVTGTIMLGTVAATPVVLAGRWIYNKFNRPPTLEEAKEFPRIDAHGSARFLDVTQFQSLGHPAHGLHMGRSVTQSFLVTKNGRQSTIGGERGPVFYTLPERHTFIAAPTRSGKGTNILIPTLLQYRGSLLAIDPKGELACITARQRQRLGQEVAVLNPWDLFSEFFAEHKIPSLSINPLDLLDPASPRCIGNARFITDLCVLSSGNAKDDFWNDSAKQLITGLLLYITAYEPQRKNLGRLRELLTQSKADFDQTCIAMAASERFGGAIREAGNFILGAPENTRGGILSTAQTQTAFLQDDTIKKSLATSTFPIKSLMEKPVSLFLIIPLDEIKTNPRWLRLIVGLAIKTFQTPHPIKNRCLFLLEEFAALGHMAALESAVATIAGFGVDLTFVLQDLNQLEQAYGKGMGTFLAGTYYQFFTNINDQKTAEYVSKRLGSETVPVTSTSTSTSPAGQATASVSTSSIARPLRTVDELMKEGPEQGYLFPHDMAPVLLNYRSYLRVPSLLELADQNPHHPPPPKHAPPPVPTPKGFFKRVTGFFSSAPGVPAEPPKPYADPARSNAIAFYEFLPLVHKDLLTLKPKLAPLIARYIATSEKGRVFILWRIPPDAVPDLCDVLLKAAAVYKKAARKADDEDAQIAFLHKHYACDYFARIYNAGLSVEQVSYKGISDLLDLSQNLTPTQPPEPVSAPLSVPPPAPLTPPEPTANVTPEPPRASINQHLPYQDHNRTNERAVHLLKVAFWDDSNHDRNVDCTAEQFHPEPADEWKALKELSTIYARAASLIEPNDSTRARLYQRKSQALAYLSEAYKQGLQHSPLASRAVSELLDGLKPKPAVPDTKPQTPADPPPPAPSRPSKPPVLGKWTKLRIAEPPPPDPTPTGTLLDLIDQFLPLLEKDLKDAPPSRGSEELLRFIPSLGEAIAHAASAAYDENWPILEELPRIFSDAAEFYLVTFINKYPGYPDTLPGQATRCYRLCKYIAYRAPMRLYNPDVSAADYEIFLANLPPP